jgi:hypothetical protein
MVPEPVEQRCFKRDVSSVTRCSSWIVLKPSPGCLIGFDQFVDLSLAAELFLEIIGKLIDFVRQKGSRSATRCLKNCISKECSEAQRVQGGCVDPIPPTSPEPKKLFLEVSGGGSGERYCKDLAGIDSFFQEASKAMHHGECLAGSGPRQDVDRRPGLGGNRQLHAGDTLLPRHVR